MTPPGRVLVVVAALVAIAALIAYPLLRLTGTLAGLGPDSIAVALGGAGGRAVATSLGLGIVVATMAVVLGTTAAFVGERASTRGRWIVRGAMVGQLFVPPFVAALGWAAAYGPRGLTDRWLGLSKEWGRSAPDRASGSGPPRSGR